MLVLNRIKVILVLFSACLLLGVAFNSQGDDNKKRVGPATIISTDQLGGAERYLIYASVDKPVYREKESVYLRATFLNAADNTPMSNGYADINVQIKGPKGDVVHNSYANDTDSVVGSKWVIPEGTAGGQYTAIVSSSSVGAPATERQFEIRAYRAPRLKTQIEFAREGVGPGDEVQASIKIDRAEGGIPDGAKISVIARVDGEEIYKKEGFSLGESGVFSTQFSLPKTIEIGDGSLSFVIEDGGVIETASKTLPILLQNMVINFYPEGGDLVAGLNNRVYVQANRPDGKPADIEGRIVTYSDGKVVGKKSATLTTIHEGRGVFSFAPAANTQYALVLDSPSGISRQFKLPKVKNSGTVLQSTQDVFAYGDSISLTVASNGEREVSKVTLYKRETLIDTQSISEKKDLHSISLNAKDAEGVLIATAWSANGIPLAERLIYRQPKFAVNVSLVPSKEQYVPGEEVSIDIVTTDASGNPVEAVVGVTVTDDAVREIIETREQAPRLPVMVYLENDVKDLADAHVYLDVGNKEAPKAVDLLLGTQGWRRFMLVDYADAKVQYTEAAMRAFAERSRPRVMVRRMRFDERAMVAVEVPQAEQGQVQKNAVEVPEPVALEEEVLVDEPDFIVVEAPKANVANADQGFVLNKVEAEADMMFMEAPRQVVVFREYAHQVRANRKANDRVDFTETLYWNKGVRTSARDGKATVKFGLSDSVTSFRVMGDAFGRNGALGAGDALISSVEPFYIEPKMPLEASVGDVIELPVAMVNASDKNISQANLLVKGEGLNIQQVDSIKLNAGERVRQIVRIKVDKAGLFPLVISAAAGPFADRVTRTLVVKPNGFPVNVNHGGLVGPGNGFEVEVEIPTAIEGGSMVGVAKVYPSPLANMEEALNALLRQPYGCFEQTSSSTYPLVMAQQYFMSHQGVAPEKIAKAKSLLDQGYKKLIGFESKDKGYEWFGANPAHEALTAYGLMEFVDMAKVMPVDNAMIERTRNWLLDRRDGKGGFKRNDKALDSFGSAPAPTTNAYIVWSLLESGESPSTLTVEIAAIKEQALKSEDSYVIALAANILYMANDPSAAQKLSQKLVDAVNTQGAVAKADTSITRSGGDSLAIETTSLALLAWLKEDARWAANTETSMKWLFERSQSGRFGSTQSTILALKAINAYDAARAKPKKAGTVQLLIDGEAFGKPVAFDKDSKGAIELPDFAASLTPGKHTLALRMNDGSEMPFALEVGYNSSLPVSSDNTLITVSTTLSTNKIIEGEPLEMQVSVSVGNEIAPTPIAIIGIPAGLDVQHDKLKELVGADRISSYEVIGREVILYWRALQANETRDIPINLVASVPGSFAGPASRTYLYYTDEYKHWVAGQKVEVTAK